MGTPAPEAWDLIASRDFRSWRGLPAEAAYADFEARFPRLMDAEARGLLGTENAIGHYRMHTADGYPQHLKAWRSESRLILVEATLPQLRTPLEELIPELGEPAARLDFTWDVLRVSRGARIHPDRGIALFVGPERQLLKLSLFEAGELSGYLATRHHEDRPPRES